MTQKTSQNPWTMDVRVRERNLRSGALLDKDLEKYLSGLPDVGDQAEPFATPQPALAQPPAPPPPPPAPAPIAEPRLAASEPSDVDLEPPSEPEVGAGEIVAPVDDVGSATGDAGDGEGTP